MLFDYLQKIPHLNLNKTLPDECISELLSIDDFYGLKLKENYPNNMRTRYYNTSKGHALKSYSGKKENAYYTPNSNAIDTENYIIDTPSYNFTSTWHKLNLTRKWINKNICNEKNLCMVCLHMMTKNSYVDWHSHYKEEDEYNIGIIHISLKTNPRDLSEVKKDDCIISKHYAKSECWLFNSWLQHRSINKGEESRLHLVLECKFEDEIFMKTIKDVLGYV